MKEVGIINMYPTSEYIVKLIDALAHLEYTPHIYSGNSLGTEGIYTTIKNSSIPIWIFSGSDESPISSNAQVPLKAFSLKKRIICICFSMESVLYQLGVPMKKRANVKRESFLLHIGSKRIHVWRNHAYYFKKSDIVLRNFSLLSSFRGEAMIINYKGQILSQFHPEYTEDGIKLLKEWLL